MNIMYARELYKLEGKTFDITFIKKDGEVVDAKDVVCTSFYSSGATMNIKFVGYSHPIKINRLQITHINGKELIQ